MAAIDPLQGVEGAVFSLREMFSGSTKSIVGRFEMDKKTMEGIKNLPVAEQLVKIDEYFNKIGMTQKLIDDMGNTSLGIWAQVSEKFQILLRTMGEPSLKVVSDFLLNVLGKLENGELDRFADIGAGWIKEILSGLTNSAIGIYEWFTALTASEKFKSKTTLYGKVRFVFDDIFKNFREWLDDKGKAKIQSVSQAVIETLAGAIDASMDSIKPVAEKLGSAIWDGISAGFKANVDESMILSTFRNMLPKGFKMPSEWREDIKEDKKAGGKGPWGAFFGGGKKKDEPASKKTEKNKSVTGAPIRAFNGGTDRIHRDGLYYLHKSEAVLNRGKADRYRKEKSESEPAGFTKFTPQRIVQAAQQNVVASADSAPAPSKAKLVQLTIAKLADQIIVREEADIDKIASKLATRIYEAGEAGAAWRG